jgi:hypothetical protein
MRWAVAVMMTLSTALPCVAGRDFVATPQDFRCITDGKPVPGKHFFISHGNRRLLRKAVRISKRGKAGLHYPVGTVLQLLPFEAMAKRAKGFNPEGDDWEFFQIAPSAAGSTIVSRGKAEVANVIGSCQGCHMNLAAQHDAVCEFTVGANGLGLTDEQIAAIQAADPRCAAAGVDRHVRGE